MAINLQLTCLLTYLFFFSALTLMVGWQEGYLACKKTEWWDAGVVMYLGEGAGDKISSLYPLVFKI